MESIEIGDVVQFNENHKWCGCLGIVNEKKILEDGIKIMVGVPIPQQGTAYIFVMNNEIAIEKIGKARLIIKDKEE